MIELSVAGAAAALGVEQRLVHPRARIVDVVIDSRAVGPGSLFVALPGERVDGHDFVAAALARGAVAAVTQRPLPEVLGDCLVVDDPVLALGRLARHVVDDAVTHGLQVVAITGSQGKTSTKDLLAQVLEQAGPTVAPVGNLNNELGVPLTASRVDRDTRFLVAEMGARGVGHIAYLCRIAPPRVSVVLNVGQAHVGEFGSQQAIARAKGELVEALPPGGTAVLNADDPLVWAMRERTAAPVLAFSVRDEPDASAAVWASDIVRDDVGRHGFLLHAKGTNSHPAVQVQLRLSGRHHVANAVAAAGAALALGLELPAVAAALSAGLLRSPSRMALHERPDSVVVIDDAYNANPDSTRAAVDTLVEIAQARRDRRPGVRSWAVLGDMLELGATGPSEHAAMGRHVAEAGVDRLVAVGELSRLLAEAAVGAGLDPAAVVWVPDKTTAAQLVQDGLAPGDVVLVKASRGLALETVAEQLRTAAATERGRSPAPSTAAEPERTDPA